jgi:hypothetical protein
MKLRAALALALLSSLLLLASLAYASPPDPSWISGFYDDADFDNIIGLITSEAGVIERFGAGDNGPAEVVVATVVCREQEPALCPSSSSDAIRAPPAP